MTKLIDVQDLVEKIISQLNTTKIGLVRNSLQVTPPIYGPSGTLWSHGEVSYTISTAKMAAGKLKIKIDEQDGGTGAIVFVCPGDYTQFAIQCALKDLQKTLEKLFSTAPW